MTEGIASANEPTALAIVEAPFIPANSRPFANILEVADTPVLNASACVFFSSLLRLVDFCGIPRVINPPFISVSAPNTRVISSFTILLTNLLNFFGDTTLNLNVSSVLSTFPSFLSAIFSAICLAFLIGTEFFTTTDCRVNPDFPSPSISI